MYRKSAALLSALLTAGVLSHSAAAPRPEDRPAVRALAEAITELELGAPRAFQGLSALFSPGEEPSPTPEGEEAMALLPVPTPERAAGTEDEPAPSPEGTATPAPSETPEETPLPSAEAEETPAPSETPAPAPTAETPFPAPTQEIRSFTDSAEGRVKNATSLEPDLEALAAEPLRQHLPAQGAQILIIHTHGTEAYTAAEGEAYEESDPYRTTDPAHSVIRVGDALQAALEAAGLTVVHDRNFYDYPSYAGSYSRSEAAIEVWLALCPDIGVVIDLHRDAVGSEDVIYKNLARLPGEEAAQVMLVVGTGENGLPHPLWQENLKLALAMQSALEESCPTLARPIQLARERYNQQLTTGSLILEIGTNGNTLSEACRAAELFGQAVAPLLLSLAGD